MPKPTSDCRATKRKHPWPMVRLGDVCEVRAGANYRDVEDPNGCYPIYGTGGIMGMASQYRCPAHSVIVGRKGTLDNPFLVDEPFWNIDTCFGVVPSERIIPEYLFRFCQGFDFYSLVPASGRPSTTSDAVRAIEIPLPSLSKQKEIVVRLERELAAVEKVKKGFEALAETAKAEFKAELKEVFEELKSGGAEMRRLEEVCELKAGGDKPTTFSKCATDTMRIPVVSNGIQNDGICGYTDVATDHAGCVTVSARGTIGWSCIRDYSFVPIVRLIVVRPKDKVNVGYLVRILQQLSFNQSGSSIPQLTVPMLKGVEIPLPSLSAQLQIVNRLSAAKARAEKLEAKAREGVAVCETMRKAILKEAFE